MAKIQYREQWAVPSESEGDKTYKVSLTMDGKYKCSCKHWIFRLQKTGQDCKHIQDVKNGVYDHEVKPTFYLSIQNVREVTLDDDRQTVLIPMRPADDTHFLLTIVYDCLQLGVGWKEICDYEHLPRYISRAALEAHVKRYGRKIWGPWIEGKGYHGFEYVRVQ